MTTGDELVKSGALMIAKHFGDETFEEMANLEDLKRILSEKIVYLMLNEMEKLLSILYRIDISEKKVKEAFAGNNPAVIAPTLAGLIIERELEKARSRLAHKNTTK